MYEKDLGVQILLDFYGELLTEKQRETMLAYYEDDMSLGEIASQLGITRQGVRDSIKRGEEQLRGYEEKLGLAARFRGTVETANKIRALAVGIKEFHLVDEFKVITVDGELLSAGDLLTCLL